MRSLLPPNAGDNDSIYSEEDNLAALQMVRAPERERTIPSTRHASQIMNSSQPLDHTSNTLRSQMSQEQLHGTNKIHADDVTTMNNFTGISSDMLENNAVADPEKIPEESDNEGKKKKKKKSKKKSKKNK